MPSGVMPAILRSAPEPHGSREATRGCGRPRSIQGLLFSFQGPSTRFFETHCVEGVGNDEAAGPIAQLV